MEQSKIIVTLETYQVLVGIELDLDSKSSPLRCALGLGGAVCHAPPVGVKTDGSRVGGPELCV